LAIAAVVALAHGGNEHIIGTIATVENDRVTVKTTDGKTVAAILNSSTKYLKDKGKVTKADLAPGIRVVIDAKMDAKTKAYSALEVRVGVAAAAAKPTR
jgi:hypothetical protein